MTVSASLEPHTSGTTGLHRWIPRLIFAAATVHILVGVVASGSHWRGIFSDGLWNTVANDDDTRMMTLWFMLAGIAFVGLGLLTRRTVILTSRIPAETGWILLTLGIPMALLEPISGGWAMIAIGVLALALSRRDKTASGSSQAPTRA
ncbi:DUF6463 family protein [Spirillospora sp. NBC_00431]